MSDFAIRIFQPSDADKVIDIWKQCGLTRSWNDSSLDIKRKSTCQSELFFVGELKSDVIATAMFGFDGNRGWLHYFAVLPKYQKEGFGRELLEFGEKELIAIGCPKLNLQVRAENTEAMNFYRTVGYTEENRISFGKRLIEDE